MRSIKYQILLPVVIIVLTLSVVLTVASVLNGSKNIQEEALNRIKYEAASFEDLSLTFSDAKSEMSNLGHFITQRLTENGMTSDYVNNQFSVELKNYVSSILKDSQIYTNIDFIINSNNVFSYFTFGITNSNDFQMTNNNNINYLTNNRQEVQWYFDTVNSNKGLWIEPHDQMGKTIVTFTQPVVMNNKIIGVVDVDIDFNDLKILF